MEVITAPPSAPKEITRQLGSIKPGVELFRFAHDSLEDAIRGSLFFIRIHAPEAKFPRIVNVSDGVVLERDPDHRVVVQPCKLVLDL